MKLVLEVPSSAGLLLAVVLVFACMEVVRKAGYARWWALLVLVPGVNLVAFLWFAFRTWPLHRRLPDEATGAPRGSVIAGID